MLQQDYCTNEMRGIRSQKQVLSADNGGFKKNHKEMNVQYFKMNK